MAEAVLPFALCAAHAPARFRRGARTYALAYRDVGPSVEEHEALAGSDRVAARRRGLPQRDGDHDLELEDPAPG
jgi:hypothetical protein